MKKTALTFFIILMGMSIFAQNGVIRELSGTVELKASGASAFVPAKAGDQINPEMVISTGFKSTALVAVGSALITVRPLTRLTLTEIRAAAGTETLNVNLQAGRVRVDVNPPAGTKASMSVSSPMATASVRGTSFEFDTRNLSVNHGRVNFQGNKGHARTVSGGASSRVEEDGRAADPIHVKIAGLTPTPPVGTDLTSGNTGGSKSSSGGVIVIEPQWPSIPDGYLGGGL